MTLKDWLQEQPFTLTLSAGFFSFFAHCGMVSVLEDEGLYPTKITGASAGALIGAGWASGCSVSRMQDRLFSLSKADFWDPRFGLGLLKGQLFRHLVAEVAEAERLEDCPTPIALSVSDLCSRTTHVLTHGPLAEAVHASGAVPFLFHPVCIHGRYYVDGGLTDRHGLAGADAGSRILYHHIATRSPWRRKNSPALVIPHRANLVTLEIENLPRSGPNRLDQGKLAYAHARQATHWALTQPVHQNTVCVPNQEANIFSI